MKRKVGRLLNSPLGCLTSVPFFPSLYKVTPVNPGSRVRDAWGPALGGAVDTWLLLTRSKHQGGWTAQQPGFAQPLTLACMALHSHRWPWPATGQAFLNSVCSGEPSSPSPLLPKANLRAQGSAVQHEIKHTLFTIEHQGTQKLKHNHLDISCT